MAKRSWSYSGKTPNGTLSGRVTADTFEEADTIVRNMGFKNAVVVPTENVGADVPQHIVESAATGNIPVAPAPPPMSARQQAQERDLHAMLKRYADHIDEGESLAEGMQPVRMRQTLVLGLETGLMIKIDPLLDAGGRIVNIKMCPNHHGQIFLAVVIEHPDIEPKQEIKP